MSVTFTNFLLKAPAIVAEPFIVPRTVLSMAFSVMELPHGERLMV
jgi:hypothetical protein